MDIAAAVAPFILVGLVLSAVVANSLNAVANAKAICEAHLGAQYELEIVDVLKDPRRALADGIIVTPTLLKLLPLPVQRSLWLSERLPANLCQPGAGQPVCALAFLEYVSY